jgi:tRNA modification GTPase
MTFKYSLDTIVAISTPPGYGGIAIVRMSGKNAILLAQKHFCTKKGTKLDNIVSRKVNYGFFISDEGNVIDECLLILMKEPYSYTGEDVVEFQIHGGNIVAIRVVEELLKNRGLVRYAEPGEFTYRAFLHGKKDLIQAEAIENLIHAKNYFQQENSVKQLSGYLSSKLKDYFDYFNEIRIMLEAEINFPEEISFEKIDIKEKLHDFNHFLNELIASYNESKPYVDGLSAIIIGKPNVGKSSFMNKLLDNERVIVSPYPGTTRDIIEETIILEGVPLKIIDTAGIRNTKDPIEKIGIERAKNKIKKAKIVFAIFDASYDLTEEDYEILDLIRDKELVFIILNKIDIGKKLLDCKIFSSFTVCPLSLQTGEGFNHFKNVFKDSILKIFSINAKRDFYVIQPRHYEIFLEMKQIIEDYLNETASDEALLFALTELNALYERLIGKNISSEDVDKIFSRFCIGK